MRIQTTKVYSIISNAIRNNYTTISEQGSARCFGRGTLVRMADGRTKPVEEISVGDRLMSADGKGYNTVIETHSGIDNLFKVHQHKGIDYIVNSNHLLTLKQTQHFYKKVAIAGFKSAEKRQLIPIPYDKHEITDIPVNEYLAKSGAWRSKFAAFKQTKVCGKNCPRDYFTTKIDVTPCGRGEFFGFTLDKSPYFLLKDGTVCHNSGKTWNTCIFLIAYALQHPNTTISIVRKTNPALTGSVLRDFINIVQQLNVYDKADFNKTSQVYTFKNGSWVEFFSTDNEQKLRGRKRQILYVNEGNELLEIEWKQLKMRTTKFAIIDYNPSYTDEHWLNGLNRDERTYHFITTYKDNPFLEQVVIDEIESYKDTNPSLWRIYGLGLQAIVEGVIFDNWEEVEEFPEYAKHQTLGLDFGYQNDPTACVRCGMIGDELYLDELFYETKLTASQIVERLLPWKDYDVIADSADPRLIQEIFNGGILIYPVIKGAGSIMAGIMKMKEFKIKVTQRSVNLIKELKNYTYQQDREGNWLNKPIDAYNHAIDASRYYVLGEVLGKVSKVVEINESDISIW